MKIAVSYKGVTLPQPVASTVDRHIHKINTLLKSYAPDLVHLHGSFEKHPHAVKFTFSVNLSLPTGALHATADGSDARVCAQKALVELEAQIKKHKALLRKDYEWKRKRPRTAQAPA